MVFVNVTVDVPSSSSSDKPHHPPGHPLHELSKKSSFRVISKVDHNFNLTIKGGKVLLARSNPKDLHQHWYKEEKYGGTVKDQNGHPSFALVNKATGQALKHSKGHTHPMELVAYNPKIMDMSILWTQGADWGDDYRVIRMVNNTGLHIDAAGADINGAHDGTNIVCWNWNRGNPKQLWKIAHF
ncbi:ricin B-like lectin EULS3 [Tripterygium wilfordii]|uniref:ricin B-like lectin EULS3 n=1 Tax=Tripterygium wilfordii TaxID=458696 RepID=UPI0018F816BE|nr:ricin B-like lectin EULS3 [Tripterygium wilfordii]